jgi:hypothetical protein
LLGQHGPAPLISRCHGSPIAKEAVDRIGKLYRVE